MSTFTYHCASTACTSPHEVRADKVTFEPEHVAFWDVFGSSRRLILAEKNVNVSGLTEHP